MQLDLRSLPREDGPPTELQARREKFAFFEKHCSEVSQVGLLQVCRGVVPHRQYPKSRCLAAHPC